ncbi:MAG: hypothetical protein S4CHLAM6_15160 [Chlamydiae bacterium]|nr:hypothetical protein [Chlamydiota bacterium]
MAIALKEMLQALTKMQVDLTINDNRSTMISILERKRKYARISIHRMFLNSTNEVVIALAELVKNKKSKEHSQTIRHFIDESSTDYEYREKLDKKKLDALGNFFDLNELYQKVNKQYFQSELDLSITWFGNKNRRPKSQICFGLYQQPLKLVKINRILDQKNTPTYFIEYIIYHEMLHHIYRPETSASGYRRIHTQKFREKEKEFLDYNQAKDWENQFKISFFK